MKLTSSILILFICSCAQQILMCPSATCDQIDTENNKELKKVGSRFNSKLKYHGDSLINVTNFSEYIESGLHSNSELYHITLFDKKLKEQIPCFLYHGEFINQSSFIFPIYRDEFDSRLFQYYRIKNGSSDFTKAVNEVVGLINQLSDPHVNKIEQKHQGDSITVTFELKDQTNEAILFYTQPSGEHFRYLIAKKR